MKYNTENAKELCLERDARRCRHCGTTENLQVNQLVSREGRLAWHLSNLITRCKQCADEAELVKNYGYDNRVGVLLCGGRGTRLYPLTMYQNKHTLPIGLIPMLFYPIKTLRKFGIKRVLIVTDRENTNETMRMLGSGKEFGMDFTYKIQEGAGGISDALYLAKDFVRESDDELLCILGDNIFDINSLDKDIELKHAYEYHEGAKKPDRACVWLKHVKNPVAYGVATVENDKVTEIIEKPDNPKTDLAVVGLYLYPTHDIFDAIEQVRPSGRGELEISAVNNFYAERGELTYRMVNGYWGDAGGSIQRYAECSMHGAKEADVSLEEIDAFKSLVFDEK